MDDWLDETPAPKAGLPVVIELPDDYKARLALAEGCWARLTAKQREYLSAWRDCRFNARAASRQLGLSENTRPNTLWMQEPDYATVARVWRAHAAANALDRDRLLARQDDIVETLLTPKPVLHQGIMVRDTRPGAKPDAVLEEVEAGAAARANETLLQAAGVLKKDTDVNVNVGVVGPALSIQVMPMPPSKNAVRKGVVIDALPAPAEEVMPTAEGSTLRSVTSPASADEDWLG